MARVPGLLLGRDVSGSEADPCRDTHQGIEAETESPSIEGEGLRIAGRGTERRRAGEAPRGMRRWHGRCVGRLEIGGEDGSGFGPSKLVGSIEERRQNETTSA